MGSLLPDFPLDLSGGTIAGPGVTPVVDPGVTPVIDPGVTPPPPPPPPVGLSFSHDFGATGRNTSSSVGPLPTPDADSLGAGWQFAGGLGILVSGIYGGIDNTRITVVASFPRDNTGAGLQLVPVHEISPESFIRWSYRNAVGSSTTDVVGIQVVRNTIEILSRVYTISHPPSGARTNITVSATFAAGILTYEAVNDVSTTGGIPFDASAFGTGQVAVRTVDQTVIHSIDIVETT
jgi:hypothetical protein